MADNAECEEAEGAEHVEVVKAWVDSLCSEDGITAQCAYEGLVDGDHKIVSYTEDANYIVEAGCEDGVYSEIVKPKAELRASLVLLNTDDLQCWEYSYMTRQTNKNFKAQYESDENANWGENSACRKEVLKGQCVGIIVEDKYILSKYYIDQVDEADQSECGEARGKWTEL